MGIPQQIGHIPESPELHYDPFLVRYDTGTVGDLPGNLTSYVDGVRRLADSESLPITPGSHPAMAGLVRIDECPEEEVELAKVGALDLLAIRMGRRYATLHPTDRKTAVDEKGRIQGEGGLVFSWPEQSEVTVLSVSERRGLPWGPKPKVPYIPRSQGVGIRNLGVDVIQGVVSGVYPKTGIVLVKLRAPMMSVPRDISRR